MFRTLLALTLLVFCAVVAPAASQTGPFELEAGQRIRISGPTTDARLVTGRLVWWRPEAIAFKIEGDDAVYTRRTDFIDRVEVSRGRTGVRRGTAFGIFVGTSLGAIVAPFIDNGITESDWGSISLVGAAGGLSGAVVGSLLGMRFAREHWQPYIFTRRGL